MKREPQASAAKGSGEFRGTRFEGAQLQLGR